MTEPRRPIAFVLASTNHGAMILNRLDVRMTSATEGYGVGFNLLNSSEFDRVEARNIIALLETRRKHFGDGVHVLDIGANIGAFTLEWARHMTDWGTVLAVEAQERVFYALAGNLALNNCFNARAIWAAAAAQPGMMRMPAPDYRVAGSFGSLELRQSENTENIGQPIDYRDEAMTGVATISIDSLHCNRVDLIKIDVEGMELEVLEGARHTIARDLPILFVEYIKSPQGSLGDFIDEYGYQKFVMGLNLLAVHPSDPTLPFLLSQTSQSP